MDEYAIIITPDAEKELASLNYMPNRYKLLDDEPWHSRGVRRMNAKNFAVFYIVLEEYHEVYIQNVIYQKRDIPRILHDLYGNEIG